MSSVLRLAWGAWTARPRASSAPSARAGRFQPGLQGLEERQLLSGVADPYAPTDAEQYMLELINRARANPAAEGRRLVALAQADPVLRVATRGWDLNRFMQVIASYPASPPLAFNTRLIEAARDHSGDMLAANMQYHSTPGSLTNPSIARADDGLAYYPTGNGAWSTGENIFAYSRNVSSSDPTAFVDYFSAAFLIDWGNPSFGHLRNILAPGPGQAANTGGGGPYAEIGIGLLTNANPTVAPGLNNPVAGNQGLNVGPAIVTQEFGWRSGTPILTGSFYSDKDMNRFYSIGEGLGGVTVTAAGLNGQGSFQVQTWASGGYSLALPLGTYNVTATGNLPYPVSTRITIGTDNLAWGQGFNPKLSDQPVPGDYSGDGKTSLAVYRPGTGEWLIDGKPGATSFGWAGNDLPVPGDYDGTGHTQLAVYRPSTGEWFVLGASRGKSLGSFGGARTDIPVPGDYDGFGRTEAAFYRAGTAEWFVLGPDGVGRRMGNFGGPNMDIPVPGDYDGIGRTELAVYRPLTAEWFVLGPNGGRKITSFGQPGVDIPVPGDYNGDGRIEPAVYRPTTGEWFILTTTGAQRFAFGWSGVDVPQRGDFDGDGKTDAAVFRPTTGEWFVRLSGGGVLTRQFGQGGVSAPVAGWVSGYAILPSPQVTQALVLPRAYGTPAGTTESSRPARKPRVSKAVEPLVISARTTPRQRIAPARESALARHSGLPTAQEPRLSSSTVKS